MTQIATVTAIPKPFAGQVEVSVTRRTACGHDCESCAGCGAGTNPTLVVRAETELPLETGDRVEIYSDNRLLGAAALVYLGPVALFLLGYLLPAALPEGVRYVCGGFGFALGLALAVLYGRGMKRGVRYRVTRKL